MNFSFFSKQTIFMESIQSITVFYYMEKRIVQLQEHGQYRTAETYKTTLNSFRRFRKGKDLPFEEMNTAILSDYEYYLKKRKLVPNTISFYLKRLRAIYNKAVEEEGIEDLRPFRKSNTTPEKTIKRAVPLKIIRKLKVMNLIHNPALCFARDMFLFSFYTRGMSFIDIAYLEKTNLKNNILSYRRKKTGQALSMQWETCMKEIASRYAAKASSPYLLSIINPKEKDERRQYYNASTLINRKLKKLGRRLGLSTPLTMYVARHSWASIAREQGIPLSVISEGLGHESEKTTRIYLAALETQVINKANQKILKKL